MMRRWPLVGDDAGRSAPLTYDRRRVQCRDVETRLLVVLAGRPGTGKTTLARRLTRELRGAYVRLDAIVGPILRAAAIEDKVRAVQVGYEIAQETAWENLHAGVPVVVDGVHATHARRQGWLTVAQSTGARLEFLEIVVDDEREHRRRVARRGHGESGYLGPSWQEIQAMTYEAWDESSDGARLALETSGMDAATAEAVAMRHLHRR
jgi:predicted kinase